MLHENWKNCGVWGKTRGWGKFREGKGFTVGFWVAMAGFGAGVMMKVGLKVGAPVGFWKLGTGKLDTM